MRLFNSIEVEVEVDARNVIAPMMVHVASRTGWPMADTPSGVVCWERLIQCTSFETRWILLVSHRSDAHGLQRENQRRVFNVAESDPACQRHNGKGRYSHVPTVAD